MFCQQYSNPNNFLSKTEKWIHHPNLDDLYKPILKVNNLLNHPKTGIQFLYMLQNLFQTEWLIQS